MTDKQKAKAYDEALERAQKVTRAGGDVAMVIVQDIFPELRESNEMIRKSLIEFLTVIKAISESGRTTWAVRKEDAEMCKSFIAYLEKQKESLPISETCKENANSFADGIIEVRSFQRGMEEGRRLEKQKEQKPGATTNGKPIPTENHSVDIPLAEWSEEDEKTINDACCWIAEYAGYLMDKNYGKASMLMGLTDKLKSLRPQHHDTYYDVIHSILEMLKGIDFTQITPEHRVSLLNDIRVKCKDADECAAILDEPSWKPSEEQMEALNKARRFIPYNCDILESLYNDLKKLT